MARLLSPPCIASYPQVHDPRVREDKDGKPLEYSIALLFTQAALDSDEGKALDAEARRALRERFGKDADDLIKEGSLKLPWRHDVKSKGYPPGVVCYINASSSEKHKPQVVSIYAGADGKPEPITDKTAIYPGAIVRCSLSSYTYDNKSKGVHFGLGNVQLVDATAPRLVEHTEASADFGAGVSRPAASDASSVAALL